MTDYKKLAFETAKSLGGFWPDPRVEFTGINDQFDAYRHAYISALFADKYTVDISKWIFDKYEGWNDPPDPSSSNYEKELQATTL